MKKENIVKNNKILIVDAAFTSLQNTGKLHFSNDL